MNPLISIIIPVYNVEQYLSKCLESIIKQTYNNIEIILIDDGSSDNSKKICDEYLQKDSRIVVIHKDNEGVSIARNTGLDIAKGEYISFIDADDYIDQDMYEFLLNNLIENNADISSCGYNKVFEDRIEKGIGSDSNLLLDNVDAVKETIKKRNLFPSVWAKLYKKDCIGDIRFNPSIKLSEDYLFCFETACRCQKYFHSKQSKYNYVMRESSALHTIRYINYDDFKVSQFILKQVERKYPELLGYAEIKSIEVSIDLMYSIQVYQHNRNYEIEDECMKFLDRMSNKDISSTKYRFLLLIRKINDKVFKKIIKCRFNLKNS